MSSIEARLGSLGIDLPTPPCPPPATLPFVRSGDLLFVSGQIADGAEGTRISSGKLGADADVDSARAAAEALRDQPHRG